jgi:hypothetical protein
MNTGSGGDALGDLGETIEQARMRLASMDPQSPAYRDLRRRVGRASVRLRAQQEAAKRRAGHVRDARLAFLLPGGIWIFAGWGSWPWVLSGLVMALFGVWIADRLPDHFYGSDLEG